MKRVGIHQINYFPWVGYFNKMAKSDVFVFLDEVQLADRGRSQRTTMIDQKGKEGYLTVGFKKEGHRDLKFCDVLLNDSDWENRQINFLKGNYSKHPFFNQTMEIFESVIEKEHSNLMDVTYDSVMTIKDILGISTEIVMQSDLDYDREARKDYLMLDLTRACGGDTYLSGNGARKYMNLSIFEELGIDVQFQTFVPVAYKQFRVDDFMPGLSILDALFNLGIEGTKDYFWENMQYNEKKEICT